MKKKNFTISILLTLALLLSSCSNNLVNDNNQNYATLDVAMGSRFVSKGVTNNGSDQTDVYSYWPDSESSFAELAKSYIIVGRRTASEVATTMPTDATEVVLASGSSDVYDSIFITSTDGTTFSSGDVSKLSLGDWEFDLYAYDIAGVVDTDDSTTDLIAHTGTNGNQTKTLTAGVNYLDMKIMQEDLTSGSFDYTITTEDDLIPDTNYKFVIELTDAADENNTALDTCTLEILGSEINGDSYIVTENDHDVISGLSVGLYKLTITVSEDQDGGANYTEGNSFTSSEIVILPAQQTDADIVISGVSKYDTTLVVSVDYSDIEFPTTSNPDKNGYYVVDETTEN